MKSRRSRLGFTLAFLMFSAPCFGQEAADLAQPSADTAAKQEAARRFEHAIKLYEDADYVLALAEFERVYELVPDYRVLYNIGQVSIQLGRYARALRTLNEYVSRGGAELPSERLSAVQADLDLLKGRTATIALEVEPAGADISVDGSFIGKSPLSDVIIVDVGERTLQVKLPGYVPQAQRFTLAGGDRRQSKIVLERELASAAAATPAAAPTLIRLPADSRPSPRKSSWTWLGWTASGALAASAVVTGVLGASAAGQLEELREDPDADRAQLDAARNRAKTRLLVADVLGVAAVATGAVTLYFQLSDATEAGPSSGVRLGLAPSSVTLALEH